MQPITLIDLSTLAEEHKTLNANLNITDERVSEIETHIQKTIMSAYINHPLMGEVLRDVNSIALNNNEVAFISFQFGSFLGRTYNPFAGIEDDTNENNLEVDNLEVEG